MAERNTPEDSMEMVTLFSSSNHDAEQEAIAIHSVLEAAGIQSVVVGPSVIPSLEFRVEVPREQLEDAQRVLDEAAAATADGDQAVPIGAQHARAALLQPRQNIGMRMPVGIAEPVGNNREFG